MTIAQRFIAEAQARDENLVIQQLFATGFPVARGQLRLCKKKEKVSTEKVSNRKGVRKKTEKVSKQKRCQEEFLGLLRDVPLGTVKNLPDTFSP